MKLLDANLLLYAIDPSAPRHSQARKTLESELSGSGTVAFAWVTLLGFVRVSTNSRVFQSPLSPAEALAYVEGWLTRPNATVLHPTEGHLRILREMLLPLGTAGNLTSDAHLAALALEHGAEIVSFDADFARFPGVRWNMPSG